MQVISKNIANIFGTEKSNSNKPLKWGFFERFRVIRFLHRNFIKLTILNIEILVSEIFCDQQLFTNISSF